MNNKERKAIKKRFSIEAIASVVEVCYLTEKENIYEVYELCSFLLGENVDPGNIREKRDEIMSYLIMQYPTLKRTIFLANGCRLSRNKINEKVEEYKEKYGNSLEIVSTKYDSIKTLKNIR